MNVRQLTAEFAGALQFGLDIDDPDDRLLYQHFLVVFNRAVLGFKERGYGSETLVMLGKMYLRLRRVVKKSEKKELKEWLQYAEQILVAFGTGNGVVAKWGPKLF